MFKNSYLVANLIFIVAWLSIFFWRKDTRKELVRVSLIWGVLSFALQPLFLVDWWHPETITGTKLGIEDFMFCFFGVGGFSVLYEILFKKKSIKLLERKRKRKNQILGFLTILLFFGLNYSAFFIFNFHSFYSSLIAFGVIISFIWVIRRDLILPSLIIGLLAVPLGLLWFLWVEWTSPGWVESAWFLDRLSGIIILKAPVEDLIWAFLVGAYTSVIYKFWNSNKFIKIKQ